MNKVSLFFSIIIAIFIGWFANEYAKPFIIGSPLDEITTVDTDNNKSSDTIVRKKQRVIKYWQSPMDPTYIREKPGKSPMGMDLIAVYEDEEDEGSGDDENHPGTVKIKSEFIQTIGVRSQKTKKRDISREISAVGTVEPNEQSIKHISPKISGWVSQMFIDTEGAEVQKNEPLLSLYSPELVSTQEEYLLAIGFYKELENSTFKSITKNSKKLIGSARRRLKYFDVPEHQIREIEKTGKIYKDLHIHSPYEGVVTKLKVRPGMHVKPGMLLYEITDLSSVWIYADLYEYEIPWINVNDKVEITLTALPGTLYTGKITYIYPYLNKKSRTIKVRIEVENNNLLLKPDMFANVKIYADLKKDRLTIPTEAILFSGEKKVVLIMASGGKFYPQEITIGVGSGKYTEVLSGLKENDEVVTSSQFLIDSESKLNEVLEKMLRNREQDTEKEHSSL